MKKLIIVVLLAAAGYWGYKNFGFANTGAFDKDGNPGVLLFTVNGCGQPCDDVAGDLRSRDIAFEEIDVATDEGRSRIEKFGVMQLPFTVIGNMKIVGSNLTAIESALGEVMGMDVLTPAVQQTMANHFDENGKPRVVVYGTTTCPYCNRMKQHMDRQKIAYLFVDVAGYGSSRSDFNTLRGSGYPLIFVGFRRIDGYSESKVDEAVKDLL
jgi:glutaredoxin